MQIAILGPLLVEEDERPIEIGGARLRALLIRLAADPGRWVPVSTLIDVLWPQSPPADAVNALQSLVSRLRRALGRSALATPGQPMPIGPGQPVAIKAGPVIESGTAGYRLNLAAESIDAFRFERLAVQGRGQVGAGRADLAEASLREALELWRGEALADVIEAPYARAWAQRLEELRIGAVQDRIDAALQLGRHAEVVAELEELAARHPLRERTHGLLIRALAGSGRQAEALAGYEQVRRTLADELGLDPSPELQDLHLAVLRDSGDPRNGSGQNGAGHAHPARRTNLRAQLTSFVGRQDDVRGLSELLGRARLVTLVGAGGAGKTRLASEVGAELTRRTLAHAGQPATIGAAGQPATIGADGVWLVELAPVTDPQDVAATVLGSIGTRETAVLERRPQLHRDAATRLLEVLSDHDAVLLLDNCEHLLDAAAKLAEYLLGQCPRLRVLATSREPLGIVGESLWPVPPLAAPEQATTLGPDDDGLGTPAVLLFADRAALVRPGFAVTAENWPAVAEICRRLDGLPLAIELAAARLRSLPVEAVADRLGDRFRLLTGGSRTAMPRHQTLRAVVAWSWDLLTEPERLLAERLSVFLGGASAGTAGAICAGILDRPGEGGIEPLLDVPELLVSLTDKSLLVAVDPSADDPGGAGGAGTELRYRMLETIREFAAERLAERGQAEALRAAHAAYFLQLAETADPLLRGPDQLIWLHRIGTERDNLFGAMRYAAQSEDAGTALRLGAALSWYWTLLGRHDEAAAFLDQALAVPGRGPAGAYAVCRAVHALSAAAAGWGAPPVQELRGLLDGLDVLAGHPLLALVEPGIGLLLDDAAQMQAALERNLQHPDPWARAMLYLLNALAGENDGDIARLEQDLPHALEGFRRIGDRWGISTALGLLANLRAARGDTLAAIANLDEARQLTMELRASDDESYALIRIGMLRLRLDDLAGARRDIESAQRIATSSGAPMSSSFCRFALAMLAGHQGDDGTARQLAEEALAMLERTPFATTQVQAVILCGLSVMDVRAGEFEPARAHAADAYDSAVATRDMPIVAMVATAAADLMVACAEPARAAQLLGAGSRLRGLDDVGDLDLQRVARSAALALGPAEFERHRSHGRGLDRAGALALLEAAVRPGSLEAAGSGAAAVGPHGQRREHGRDADRPQQ